MVLLNICLSSTNRRIYFTPYIFDWPFIRSYAFTPVPIRPPHAFTVFPGLDGLPALSLPIFILRVLPLPLTIPLPATGYMAIPPSGRAFVCRVPAYVFQYIQRLLCVGIPDFEMEMWPSRTPSITAQCDLLTPPLYRHHSLLRVKVYLKALLFILLNNNPVGNFF